MSSDNTTFDVVIVGGRPAGATLALRLARAGLAVAVLDKATFPSSPQVPSNPVLYAVSMRILEEELGIPESSYEHVSTPARHAAIDFTGRFRAPFGALPVLHGRDYVRGLDRAGFDNVLWQRLSSEKNITAVAGFGVTALVKNDEGRVCGVEGARDGGEPEVFRARRFVVGADGRHSTVARLAGLQIVEEQAEHTSTAHFAEWENVAPLAGAGGAPSLHIVSSGKGKNVLFFPQGPGRVSVCTHIRSDRADVGGDVEGFYERELAAFPEVQERLANAKRVTAVVGLKQVANAYREPGRDGVVLVGDALHHKDPVDGQGIYDALVEARALAPLIVEYAAGKLEEAALLTRYDAAVHEATGAMFKATMKRLAQELYAEPPAVVVSTLIRWSLQDPEYQRRFLLFLGRAIDPATWMTPGLMLGAAARGIGRDVGRLFGGKKTATPARAA